MGFPTETQVIEAAKKLMRKDDGAFVRTNGLWHTLMFLRYCACKEGVKEYEFQAHDLAQAAFDLNGINLPVASGVRNAYLEAGATQGNKVSDFFRHHEGPRQTYLNRIYTGLAGAGPRQPKIFNVSRTSLPVKIALRNDWLENLRSNEDNHFILDSRVHELVTWIFRFGIPMDGQNTSHFATHAGNGNLNIDSNVSATALPSTIDQLEESLSKYLSLSRPQLKTLMPEIDHVRLDEWTGQTAIDIPSFGPRLISELNGVTPEQEMHGDLASIAIHFTDNAVSAKLRVGHSTALRLVAAMLAKRFVILTGLSGSGKTKLAHAFAAWIAASEDQYRLVAVGADWTTNENIVGYQDALQVGIYRKPSNGALDVILRAENDPARPYFLILDEMNLSHVERYFADILSAVESGQEIALHASAESLKASEDDPLPVPPKIRLPNNLFIIGTVNVDETTYMFSPKVLDRANVIEFRATADDIAAFLDAPSKVDMERLAGKGAAFGEAFVVEACTDAQLDSATAADLKARLTEIFGALAPIGAEFGFRTAYEITRFTYFHAKLSGEGWQFKDALDAQVLQKLLPKLHGSERRLGPVLKALEAFCTTHECDASLIKIRRMQDRLKDGFTSFAEA